MRSDWSVSEKGQPEMMSAHLMTNAATVRGETVQQVVLPYGPWIDYMTRQFQGNPIMPEAKLLLQLVSFAKQLHPHGLFQHM